MKVLIAVDGSAGSFEAVDQMARVLSAERDDVALYCSPPAVRVPHRQQEPKILASAQQGLADAIFDEARKRLPEGLQSRVHAITGTHDARHGVPLEAEAWGAELIAMGARGLSTLERLLLGSVSHAVVHHSTIPVWVARARPPQAHGRAMNVLLACERPPQGEPAAALLARLSWPSGSKFYVHSVVQSIFAGRVPDWLEQQARAPDVEAMVQAWVKEHEEELRARRATMEEFVRALAPPLNAGQVLVTEGEPAREILAAVEKENIDLVVVGSQHKRTVASIILGSTSEAVLNHAPCSVLVVPQRGAG
jgi:nucleotide-binding universal stress UspA family protein